MKLLVTVGTTRFESLIRVLDDLSPDTYRIDVQLADGRHVPRQHNWFRFSPDISAYYRRADLVISHAGAGTVYQLLEMGKPILLVPNLERDDKHQRDLFEYMVENRHTFGAARPSELAAVLPRAISALDSLVPYKVRRFNDMAALLQCLRL